MATRSRTASQAQSPFNQGYMEPSLLPTTSIENGKVSLKQVTRLLLNLLGQVKRLEQEIQPQEEPIPREYHLPLHLRVSNPPLEHLPLSLWLQQPTTPLRSRLTTPTPTQAK
ncbi:hypothetical protein RHS03_09824, partial [Rhizoctonia solani]